MYVVDRPIVSNYVCNDKSSKENVIGRLELLGLRRVINTDEHGLSFPLCRFSLDNCTNSSLEIFISVVGDGKNKGRLELGEEFDRILRTHMREGVNAFSGVEYEGVANGAWYRVEVYEVEGF